MKEKVKPVWGYKLLKPILSPLFKFYYNPKIFNREVIPKEGPILIVGNHMHIMDQCSVIVSTKRVVHYMAKREYFDGKFAWFFKITGCISVDRSIHDASAKESALNILKSGGAVGLFPEGTRNKTEEFLLPFKMGTVSMAQKTGATIVPFGVTGDYKFRSKNLTVRFGEPFKVEKGESLEVANKRLETIIGSLMRENLEKSSDTTRK